MYALDGNTGSGNQESEKKENSSSNLMFNLCRNQGVLVVEMENRLRGLIHTYEGDVRCRLSIVIRHPSTSLLACGIAE